MKRLLAVVAIVLSAHPAGAQVITTYAGGGVGDGLPAAQAPLAGPRNLAVDGAGNVFIADADNDRVRRVDAATGVVSTVVGNGDRWFSGDGGPATVAAINRPNGVLFDAQGNLLVSDSNYTIRKVDAATGVITPFAGVSPNYGFAGDGGPATLAWMTTLHQMARDSAGNIYVADFGNERIRRISAATGIISTVAGGGGGGDGGPATNAGLQLPIGVAIDGSDNLYIAELVGQRVRKVSLATGIISTVAGTGSAGSAGDGGAATAATLNAPMSLAVDGGGHLFIAERDGARVRRVDAATGIITTYAGGGTGGDGGPATSAKLLAPTGIAFDGAGRLYIADGVDHRIRRVVAGTLETFAGTTTSYTGDGLAATRARLLAPGPTGSDAAGNLFIAEPEQGRIRRVAAGTNVITTYAGTGAGGSTGDGGPATAATFTPAHLGVAANGDVYIGDAAGFRLRRINAATGIVETVANEGVVGGIAVDAANNVHFGSTNIVRRLDGATGVVSTEATVPNGVARIALDDNGDVYVASGGAIGRLSGGGFVPVATQDGAGGLAVRAGSIFFVPSTEARVRMRLPDGSLLNFAGIGSSFGALGDGGAADVATFRGAPLPLSIFGGALHVSDTNRGRVRRIPLDALFATPGSLAFDGRLPQTTSLAKRATLRNLGGSAVTINSVSAAPPYSVAATSCATSVAAGASCTVDATFSPIAVGSFPGAVTVSTSAGTKSVPLSGAGELSLVTFYYESILRRSPDSIGKPYWDNERARMLALGANINETWFAMSSSFFTSFEYQGLGRDANGFVTDLYRTFFNRAPDAPGLQFWIDQMANGMPREAVLAEFQLSGEFAAFTQNLFGNTAARAEIDMVMDFYRGLLGRLPDLGGYNAWVQQFRTAQCQSNPLAAVTATAESISESFATSGEYVNKNRSNGQYVGDLYNAFLRRGGDLGGVVNWINSLANATFTRKQLRDNFRASTEFTTRLSQVAAQGCLP